MVSLHYCCITAALLLLYCCFTVAATTQAPRLAEEPPKYIYISDQRAIEGHACMSTLTNSPS